MKNHSLKALSLAVATLLLQSQAQAAPSEAQLSGVKLYGDVTIAQDSVTSWGPWTEFEPPAAGAPPLAQLPNTAELYRTLALAAAPELIGFASVHTQIRTGEGLAFAAPYTIGLTGTPTKVSLAGSFLPDSFVLQVTGANAGNYPLPTSIPLTLQDGVYVSSLTPTPEGRTTLALVTNPDDPIDAQASQVSFYQLLSYLGAEDGPSRQVLLQTGVIGYATSAADMASLQNGKVKATYTGYALTIEAGFVPLIMHMDFGASTWDATVNNGANTNGTAGFHVDKGRIDGALLSTTASSTFTSTTPGSIAGSMGGSLLGTQAAAVGGNYNVTQNGTQYSGSYAGVQSATPAPTVTTSSTGTGASPK
ncbi:hypothetical protein [Aquabacterium sp.]|uniref:hypothetical protein n=1 Tax=Aquabacterium sp. TaxID=1872578 RepID=UPI0019C5B08F|nr:hypothetical protein [Aquabacterium sp.]MBC7699273.1 hypothetical protein [Aquabacterium sp.]